jgi:DNA repair protein RadC
MESKQGGGMKHTSSFAAAQLLSLDAATPITIDRDEVDSVPALSTSKSGKKPSYLADHRKRLRHRFLTGGAAAMPDYETLELTVFRAIPRQDVEPLARLLIETLGDLNAVLSALIARLERVHVVSSAVALELKVMETVTHRMARAKVMQRHVISSWDAVLDYCHTVMAHRDTEQFRVLFLDRKNVLIADEAQSNGWSITSPPTRARS